MKSVVISDADDSVGLVSIVSAKNDFISGRLWTAFTNENQTIFKKKTLLLNFLFFSLQLILTCRRYRMERRRQAESDLSISI